MSISLLLASEISASSSRLGATETFTHSDALFAERVMPEVKVAAVVSQPGKPRGRGGKQTPLPSAVEELALSHGFSQHQILCPIKANEKDFLKRIAELQPDVCVTAAYGNILPKSFLAIPKFGTLNIHPSLLPKFRGAAPVQRALQDGCSETGVTLAFTVRAMDAGPIIAQEVVPLDNNIQAPDLLQDLFLRGARLLLKALPEVWVGIAQQTAEPQDESQVSHATKISKDESVLDFRTTALDIHNKVRAFAGWPGTVGNFQLSPGGRLIENLKILKTRVVKDVWQSETRLSGTYPRVLLTNDRIIILCGNGRYDGCLEILELQPASRRPMQAKAFLNGLNGRTLGIL